ncbi:hypothetical protein RND81_01G226100 [Saponaria officinalis]|uniref:Uncharacterized protein n=1 Tax=Saponaria officinalis TaxID=3572 RepID=A0AAW1NI52_SAPOF
MKPSQESSMAGWRKVVAFLIISILFAVTLPTTIAHERTSCEKQAYKLCVHNKLATPDVCRANSDRECTQYLGRLHHIKNMWNDLWSKL